MPSRPSVPEEPTAGRPSGVFAARPTVMIAMDEAVRSRVLPPPLANRLDAAADVHSTSLSAARPPGTADSDTPIAPALLQALAGTDVLLTGWGCPRISPEMLAAAPRLRAIVHAAGSVKGFLDPVAFQRGIQVSSAVSANAVPVAEFTVAAIVLSGKRAFRLAADYRSSRQRPDLSGVPGNFGRTVGLLGASRIGRLVADRLRGFAFDVLISDPYLSPAEAAALGAELVAVDTLFSRSDTVSIHAPLLPETVGLVDKRLLGLLPDGAVLINTARGRIVEAVALERECRSGRIDAILDVTDPEPLPPGSALLDLPNVLVTPHLAGALGNEITRLGELAVAEIERLAAGLPLRHAIRADDLGRIA